MVTQEALDSETLTDFAVLIEIYLFEFLFFVVQLRMETPSLLASLCILLQIVLIDLMLWLIVRNNHIETDTGTQRMNYLVLK